VNTTEQPLAVGNRVFWWTGRGSQGHGVIRAIKGARYLIDPEPDAIKGSDFRTFAPGSRRRDVWAPRDYGVSAYQINTPPRIWYTNS
jgi:hypothetical protein